MPDSHVIRKARRGHGLTLLETLLALAIAAALAGGLWGVVGQSLQAWTATRERNELVEQTRFAMQRMVHAVQGGGRLLLPLAENPGTAWSESVRDVLAVTLDPTLDRDADGVADADNDGDGRVDEDLGRDATEDNAPGVYLVDDDGDGTVDDSGPSEDDDEDGATDEDLLDALDNDGDGSLDEDLPGDMNADGSPGVVGVDDDEDGQVDEGSSADDDEDGSQNEDWLDPVVFRLSGSTLLERLPDPGNAGGRDYSEHALAENVTQFRVERLPGTPGARAVLVDLTLELTDASGESFSLTTRVRVGGGP